MEATATNAAGDAEAEETGTMAYTGFGGAAATQTGGPAETNGGAHSLAFQVGSLYGLGVVVVGMFVGFAVLF